MEQWEYKIIIPEVRGWIEKKISSIDLEKTLNTLGEDGWELVSVSPLTAQAVSGNQNRAFIFKRKKI